MKRAMVMLTLVWLAGCECGPGVPCEVDADCPAELRCALVGSTRGYCVAPSSLRPDSDGGVDAGNGTPLGSIAATPIDFGAVACGRAAVTKPLDVSNRGTAALTFTASLSGASVFSLNTLSGSVAAGETFTLTLSATVPQSSTAGAEQRGTLRLTTNDPTLPQVEVPLKLTASGVTLALTPGIASFGLAPLNVAAPAAPLSLENLGTVTATVTLGAPADAQFSVTPATVMIAPGETASGLEAHFTPSRTTPSSSAASISVAEPTCGVSVATIPMTGQGTNGSVGISTSDLFFGNGGRVACGAQSPSRTLTLSNGGNQAYAWTGTLMKGAASPFTLTPSSGTVPASGGSVTLTLAAAPIPTQASTAEEAFGDTLSIVTDAANDSSHPVRLHMTASGAVLAFAPASIDFGGVPINTQASAPLSVVNTGNAPATVTLSSSDAAFTVAPSGATSVTGGSTGTFTATFAPGSSVTPEQAMVALDVDAGDVLCAPLPSAATLSGTGTTGSVSYSPVALDFGAVNCGATAAAQTITFSNSGNQGYTVTPSLGKGASSAFTFSLSPSSGVAAQDGGTVVITVTPKPIPQSSAVTPNLYGDTLTVTTDVSGDSAHSIPLRESARGAIFSISSGSLGFGSVPVGVTASSQFTVSNSGTQQGTLTFAPVQPTLFSLPATLTLTGGTSSSENARFTPMAVMAYSDMASVGVTSSTVLCAPLPFTTLSLSGTGSAGNVVAVSTSALTFGTSGLVPCGTQASAKTFDVTNNSSQTLTFSFTLGADATSPYTVTGPGTLAPGASGTVTVTPKPIPATSSVAADGFADSLTVTATGGPVNETHVVELHQTAQGAILSFNPTGLNFSSSGTKNFTVNNTGNLAAPYTLTVGGTNSGDFSVTPTSGTAAANGSVASSVTFSKPLLSGARSGNVAMSTNVARCAPLPSPMTLSNP